MHRIAVPSRLALCFLLATVPLSASAQVPKIRSLSRQAGATVGGTAVSIRGNNFRPGATVRFGESPATSLVVKGLEEIEATTPPAEKAGVVAVTVANSDGSFSTVERAFDYEPAPTKVFFSTGFEDGAFAPMTPEKNPKGAGIELTSEFVHHGKAAVHTWLVPGTTDKCCTSAARLNYFWDNEDPASAEPNGLYQRWYMMMTPAVAIQNAKSGQIKLLLDRYTNGSSWLIGAVGREANCTPVGQMAFFGDKGVFFLRGSCTGLMLEPMRWYEIETSFLRQNGLGRARVWVDGKLVVDDKEKRLGNDDPKALLTFQIGIAYTQNASGPVSVYIDDVAAANGWIDPEVESDAVPLKEIPAPPSAAAPNAK